MDLGLRAARVLVTGGASNIGRGIVHGFAAEAARVTICDIDGDQAAKVRAEALELGATACEIAEADLTRPGAAEDVVAGLVAQWGGIDVLVNNAGWSVPGFIAEDTDRARWQRLVEVNLFAAISCSQAALGVMREAGVGSIVFISSDAAFGEIRQGVYGATKAAVIALARTIAKEHGRHGIRSNVVCPGLVIPENDAAVGSSSLWSAGRDTVFDEKQIESLKKGIPLRRLTVADDIAAAVTWVCSETAARQVTGQVFSVSGGYSMP
ncbi:SDR family NAD(P)-dependent oxidoreductase [Nocardia jinanensis]|uniref:2-hydroxycyclohexane-1-carbonyl-CoA dehydrogenase n=1 Tax=Nocardia jinanensis TaxID=382504 RepID=A0A917VR99_9NOCA|nr:SDR family oxidoreductase [Nocardia jinanensis]GGL09988.1 2-hydroxycyclohexane-1-carbonyl-CoA dehydrogenase [Nocardia jinanensis]